METAAVIRILATGTHLYWIGAKGLVSCAKTGCTTPTVLVPGLATTALFDVDASFAYWVASNASGSNLLYRVPN